MKYFTAIIDGREEVLGCSRSAKAFLKDHPEVHNLVRWWWSGDDLIDCEEFSREKLLSESNRKNESGATAQWQQTHKPKEFPRPENDNKLS